VGVDVVHVGACPRWPRAGPSVARRSSPSSGSIPPTEHVTKSTTASVQQIASLEAYVGACQPDGSVYLSPRQVTAPYEGGTRERRLPA